MQTTHIVGIDPGLVHTGLVSMHFQPEQHELTISHEVILGDNAAAVRDWVVPDNNWPDRIFIEGYRQRSSFNTDVRMIEAVQKLKARLPSARSLDNTGVKKVVKRDLMEVLGVWKFSTPTNHQDLRSAARIALYGMLKDDTLNAMVTGVLVDHLNGKPWYIHHI